MPSRKREVAVAVALIAGGAAALGYMVVLLGLWSLAVVAVCIIALTAFHRPEWALAALVFLLPFTAVEGTASGYNMVIHGFKKIAAAAVLVAWVAHVLVRRRRFEVPRYVILPVVILGLAAGLSALRASETQIAISSSSRLMVYVGVYIVMLVDLTRDPDDLWRVLRLQLVSASLAGLSALYQFTAHFAGWPTFMNPMYETDYLLPRVHGFMQEPLWLSNFLLIVFPVACALFCWRAGRWPWLWGVAAGLSAFALVLSASRLGWACAALAFLLFLVSALPYIKPVRLVLVLGVGTLCLVAAGTMWMRSFGSIAEMGQYVKDFATFATPEAGEGDLKGHLRMLPLIAEGARTSPVIGIGTDNVGFRFSREMGLDRPRRSTTHSTYLDVFLETGGLGVLSLFWLVAASLRGAWSGFRRFRAAQEGALFLGLGLGVLAMAVHLTNWSGWREEHVWYAIGITIAASRAFARTRDSTLEDASGVVREPLNPKSSVRAYSGRL
jgi:O-antigen ligase